MRNSEATVDAAAKALGKFEIHTQHKDDGYGRFPPLKQLKEFQAENAKLKDVC